MSIYGFARGFCRFRKGFYGFCKGLFWVLDGLEIAKPCFCLQKPGFVTNA